MPGLVQREHAPFSRLPPAGQADMVPPMNMHTLSSDVPDSSTPKGGVSIRELSTFLVEYCSVQLGVGGQTQRVARTAERIAASYGCTLQLAVLPRHFIMNVSDGEKNSTWKASVGTIHNGPLNFRLLAELNNLSWKAHDHLLTFAELRDQFHAAVAVPRIKPWVVLFGASCANAAFCRLFGGDPAAMLIVFAATLVAFRLRQFMDVRGIGHHCSFITAAFVASCIAAFCGLAGMTGTPRIALGSSVLFLIPGVPMINAMLDILTGYPLMGFARSVRAGLLVICIALGLALSLFITGFDMHSIPTGTPALGSWVDMLADGLFAAVASMGFAVISNPSWRIVCGAGALAALGHSTRFYLLHQSAFGITSATFVAALLIGVLSVAVARRIHIAGEFFSFLALLPMIPGMYAYDTVLSIMRFMETADLDMADLYLTAIVKNGMTVLFVMCAMAIGSTVPLLLQRYLPAREHSDR